MHASQMLAQQMAQIRGRGAVFVMVTSTVPLLVVLFFGSYRKICVFCVVCGLTVLAQLSILHTQRLQLAACSKGEASIEPAANPARQPTEELPWG